MRVEHAFRIAGRARGVAKAGRGALVELLPLKVRVGLADPVLIGDSVLQLGRRHVAGVGQDDIALDRRQMALDRLEQRHEGEVGHDDPILGVVDDPGDLLRKEAGIDGMIDRPDSGDPVPGFEVAEAVPGERRHAVAEPDPFAIEPFGDPDGPIPDLAVVGAVHRAFDHPRGDLPIRELDRREVDDLVHQQGPFLHASQHSILHNPGGAHA